MIIKKQPSQYPVGVSLFPQPVTVIAHRAVHAGEAGVPLKAHIPLTAIGLHRQRTAEYYVIRYPNGDELCWNREHFKEVH